ncbi:MAG: hypothetical protein ACPLXA_02710 [Moorellaceae bacterium]
MPGFANQFEIGTDAKSDNIVYEVNNNNGSYYKNSTRKVENNCDCFPNDNRGDVNNNCSALKQIKGPLIFISIGFLILAVEYVIYSVFISPSLTSFLHFLYNPSFLGEKFSSEVNYARVIALSLTSYTGLLLGVKGIYNTLPLKIADSWVVVIGLLVFLLSPLGLTWILWHFHFVVKLGWTIVYLTQVWMFFVLPEI